MEVPICIFVLILGCLNSSYSQKEFSLSGLFSRDVKTPDTRTVVHIPQPSVNKGMTRTKSESSNPQNAGYILVPQVVKVPKRDSTQRSTSASQRERPSNVKRITSIDLLSDLKLNPSRDRLFNLTRIPSRDRFTDYTGSSNRDVTSERSRPSDLGRTSTRDVITELNQLSSRDRQSNLRNKPPVMPTNRMSATQIETISQILNVPKSKVLAKLPQITRIFSQAAKVSSSDINRLFSSKKEPRMTPEGPSITREPQPAPKIQLPARKYPLVQQQSRQQQSPQQQKPQQEQAARLQIQQQQVPRLQLQQPEIPKPVIQQNMPQADRMPAYTTSPQIYNNAPKMPDMISPPGMKSFTDGSERGRNQGQVSDPMNTVISPIDAAGMQQMSPDMPRFTPMDPPSMQQMSPDMPQYPPMDPTSMQQMAQDMQQYPPMDSANMQQMSPDMPRFTSMSQPKSFSDGSQISFGSQPPGAGSPMPSDLTAMQPMSQMGPDMSRYSAMGQPSPQAAMPQLGGMPTGNPMSDMSFMPPPDMSMPHGFQDPSMPMGPFGASADPACALGQVYATCTMVRIEEKSVHGDVDFSQQVDPMCRPIGNLMVNVKLFGFNAEDIYYEHGLHVHEYGDIRGHCTAAGRHYNPYQMAQGGRQSGVRQLGDFGNVREDAEGNVFQTFQIPNTSIIGPLTIVGKALVVESGPDQFGKGGMPYDALGGGHGYPAGCCVIGKSEETRSAHIYNQMPLGII